MTDRPYTDVDVERVARSLFDADQRRLVAKHAHLPGVTPGRWSDMLADTHRLYEDRSRAVLDALAAAGRLDATVARQWSVRYPGGVVDSKNFTESRARQWADESGGEVVYRAVGPWTEASRD